MMTLTHWIVLAGRASLGSLNPKLDRKRALQAGVERGVFWGEMDCATAYATLRWVMLQHGAPMADIDTMWRRFLEGRGAAMQALSEQGLQSQAFRHPRHARNAIEKFRRQGEQSADFVDGWDDEVQRRIRAAQDATLTA
jgi:hypothetical protein